MCGPYFQFPSAKSGTVPLLTLTSKTNTIIKPPNFFSASKLEKTKSQANVIILYVRSSNKSLFRPSMARASFLVYLHNQCTGHPPLISLYMHVYVCRYLHDMYNPPLLWQRVRLGEQRIWPQGTLICTCKTIFGESKTCRTSAY
jgi:hypothetical protein